MTDDTPTGSYVCICGQGFPSEMALEDHARQAHGAAEPGEVESYECPECHSTFATFKQLREHWPAHGDAPRSPGHANE
jgi:hypothetical protein